MTNKNQLISTAETEASIDAVTRLLENAPWKKGQLPEEIRNILDFVETLLQCCKAMAAGEMTKVLKLQKILTDMRISGKIPENAPLVNLFKQFSQVPHVYI